MGTLQKVIGDQVHQLRSDIRESIRKLPKVITSYVKRMHSGVLEERPEISLTSDNHAFWLGKFPKNPDSEKDIYTPELLAAILDYIKHNTVEGETANIMVSRSLSELMNGEEDVQKSITIEEEISLLETLAKKYAKKVKIQITDAEHSPAHAALFTQLRSNTVTDERGIVLGVQMAEALSGVPDLTAAPELLSLNIARLLYQTSERLPGFYTSLSGLATSKIKEKNKESQADKHSSNYYGMIEISMRIADLINCKSIQGGVDRQKRYDDIIHALLMPENKDKGWKKVRKEIEGIRDLLKNNKGEYIYSFDTVYIDSEENYFLKKSSRLQARFRLGILTLVTGTLASGMFGAGVWKERRDANEIQVKKEKVLAETVKSSKLYVGYFGEQAQPGEDVIYLRNSIDKILLLLEHRIPKLGGVYDRSSSNEELRTEIERDLDANDYEIPSLHISGYARSLYVERFIIRNRIFFISKGIQVPARHEQLPLTIEQLRKLYSEKIDYKHIDNPDVEKAVLIAPATYISTSNEYTKPLYSYHGKVYGLDSSNNTTSFTEYSREAVVEMMFREIAIEDKATMSHKVESALRFTRYMNQKEITEEAGEYNTGQYAEGTLTSKIFDKEYMFYFTTDYDTGVRVLLAKRPGDAYYSNKTTKEAAQIYEYLGQLIGFDTDPMGGYYFKVDPEIVEFFRHSIKK